MVDVGRTTRGRKVVVVVFVFVFGRGRGKREGGMQMVGGECATDIIVNFRRGPHSKLPRSWCATASGAVASSLVRHLGEYIHVWKWPVKASTQGNGLWLWLVERQNGGMCSVVNKEDAGPWTPRFEDVGM